MPETDNNSYKNDFEIKDSMNKALAVRKFNKLLPEAEKNRCTKYKLWQENEKLYHNITLDKDKRSKRSNLFVPHLKTAIQSILPRVLEVIFAGGKVLDVESRFPQTRKQAEIVSDLIQYNLDTFADGYIEFHNLVLQILKQGTGFLKVLWNPEDQTVYFRQIDISDVWIDPMATNIDNARYVIHRIETTWQHLIAQEKRGVYKGVTELRSRSHDPLDTDSLRYERLEDRAIKGDEDNGDSKVVLWELWTPQGIASIISKKHCIRLSNNSYGYIPFLRGLDYPDENNFYGAGEIELGKDLAREINKKRNQRMDNVDLILSPLIMHDSTKVDVGELYEVYPGKIISSKEALQGSMRDAITTYAPPDTTGSSVREEEMLKVEFQNSLSVNDFMQGQSGPSLNDTATGLQIVADQMTKRFRMKADILLHTVIVPLGRMIMICYSKFMTDEKVIRIASKSGDPEFATIIPGLLDGIEDMVDLKPVGYNAFVNKIAEQQQMGAMFDKLTNPVLLNLLVSKGYTIDVPELTRDYLTVYDKKISILKKIEQPLSSSDPNSQVNGQGTGQAGGQAVMPQQQLPAGGMNV